MSTNADLHIHTSYSDGTDTPVEIIEKARNIGLTTISITDHDILMDYSFLNTHGLEIITGAEITASINKKTCHILCYGADATNKPLQALLTRNRQNRMDRAQKTLKKLLNDNLISSGDIIMPKSISIGKPFIADLIIKNTAYRSRRVVIEKFLNRGKKYFVPTLMPDVKTVVDIAHKAGGICVLAHPFRNGKLNKKDVLSVVKVGVDGIEANHRDNSKTGRKWLRTLAQKKGLIVTGASDYHGAKKPNNLGENTTDAVNLERISRFCGSSLDQTFSKVL